MSNTFFASDTHFGHKNIITPKFEMANRPFKTIEEHDEALIENWNSVVQPRDRVFHLGDFSLGRSRQKLIVIGKRLNGYIFLMMANHDYFDASTYREFADLIGQPHKLDIDKRIVMSHAPVHPDSLRKAAVNVHGHLHSGFVKQFVYSAIRSRNRVDCRYLNVSMERISLTPISYDDLVAASALLKRRGKA